MAHDPLTTRVVNINKGHGFDIYCGRRSDFGNQYVTGPDGNRTQVIAQHRRDTLRDIALRQRVRREFPGKRLGCHCHPLACHCDVYAEIANAAFDPTDDLP